MSYIGNEPIVSATRTVTEVTATAGQTSFTPNGGYTVGFLDVFINGSKLTNTDFTATNGTTVTLNEAAQAGDIVRLEALGTFLTSNGVAKTGDTMSGDLTVSSGGSGVHLRASEGCIEIVRTAANPYIDFKSGFSEDFDCRIQQIDNGLSFLTGGDTTSFVRMSVDTSGRVTMPFQPAFLARKGNFTRTPWSAETSWDSQLISGTRSSHFSTSTGRFTAPVGGVYQFNIIARSNDNPTDDQVAGIQLWINGFNYQNIDVWASNAGSFGGGRRPTASCSVVVALAANDYVQASFSGNVQNSFFSGFLIG